MDKQLQVWRFASAWLSYTKPGRALPFPVFADFSQSVLFPALHMPRLDDRGLGVGHFPGQGLLFVLFHGVLTSHTVCAVSSKRCKAEAVTIDKFPQTDEALDMFPQTDEVKKRAVQTSQRMWRLW